MDFAAALERIRTFLEPRGIEWALVGGVGVAAYGLARTTLDLDLVAPCSAQNALVEFLEGLGYETLHRSRGYSNHLHPEPRLGRVDLVYVEGSTAERLFAAARALPGPGGALVPVAAPEHLIAMKVQAIVNDPERAGSDLDDIRFLLGLPGIEREQVRDYLERHGLLDRFAALLGDA